MDTRPTLDVDNLSSPTSLRVKRTRLLLKRIRTLHTKQERRRTTYILTKYRAKQTALLGEFNEDPDPYVATYVFHCFTGTLTE
jgi:Tat protein secretion system quality control protein TatD with DNase activity